MLMGSFEDGDSFMLCEFEWLLQNCGGNSVRTGNCMGIRGWQRIFWVQISEEMFPDSWIWL